MFQPGPNSEGRMTVRGRVLPAQAWDISRLMGVCIRALTGVRRLVSCDLTRSNHCGTPAPLLSSSVRLQEAVTWVTVTVVAFIRPVAIALGFRMQSMEIPLVEVPTFVSGRT